jgi:cytochrome c
MGFAGIKKTQDRADLIAYLRTLSDSPAPLPEAGAAPAADKASAPAEGAAPAEKPAEGAAPAEKPAEGAAPGRARGPGQPELIGRLLKFNGKSRVQPGFFHFHRVSQAR